MKKDIIAGAVGVFLGWVISTWINQPGKYQVVAIINPENHVMQSCLLDSRTGRIQQLYNFDNILMFGKSEATMKQWEGWQEARAKYEASKTITPSK
jgi:hypothetical protein